MKNKVKVIAIAVLSGQMLSGCSLTQLAINGQQSYHWVTLGPNGTQWARAVTKEPQCPFIRIDGNAFAMTPRHSQGKVAHFDKIISCETQLPQTAKSVDIEGKPLKLFKSRADRIVVIGDTGCRMKTGDYQNCNNISGGGTSWPFAKTAAMVAKEDADLIVHMGDYHYRETYCPPFMAGCKGPYGNNWDSWEADFFAPAAKMLPTAPWVMTRGNHEDCDRAWKGWFYLLDAYPLKEDGLTQCNPGNPSYSVELGNLTLVNMDSATLPDAFSVPVKAESVDKYRQMYDQVSALTKNSNNAWVMTHRPIWAVSSYYDWKANKNKISMTDPTMQAGLAATKTGAFEKPVNLLLAGHIHNFETLMFSDNRPSMMVVGNSGTKMSPRITKEQTDKTEVFNQLKMKYYDFFSTSRFGYAVMERQPHDAWLIRLKGLKGETLQSFTLRGKRLERIWE